MVTYSSKAKVEVLFDFGDWSICKSGGVVYGDHVDCPVVDKSRWSWFVGDEKVRCSYCKGPVPAEVQALMCLLLDRVQGDRHDRKR